MCEIAYQRYFFGFWIFSVCFTTNDFTRANSFWKPFTKLFGPYSKSTTKQKAKTTNRTSQNSLRSNPMAGRVTLSKARVNASASMFDKQGACRPRQTGSPFFLESESETPAREPFPLPMYPELTREPRGYAVDAIAEFSNKRSPIASGSSCVLRGVKLLCEAQIAGYIDARSDG